MVRPSFHALKAHKQEYANAYHWCFFFFAHSRWQCCLVCFGTTARKSARPNSRCKFVTSLCLSVCLSVSLSLSLPLSPLLPFRHHVSSCEQNDTLRLLLPYCACLLAWKSGPLLSHVPFVACFGPFARISSFIPFLGWHVPLFLAGSLTESSSRTFGLR